MFSSELLYNKYLFFAFFMGKVVAWAMADLSTDVRQIKGIGDKRVEEIMAVFEKHLGV